MKKRAKRNGSSSKIGRIARSTKFKTVLYIVSLMLWVDGIVVGTQYLAGWALLPFIKYCGLQGPYLSLLHSSLSLILALILIVLTPKWIKALRAPTPHKRKKERLYLRIKRRVTNLTNEVGLKGLNTWTDVGLAPVGYIVYLLVSFALTSLFSIFPWFNTGEAQNVGINIFVSRPEMIADFFRLVVIGPIIEEIIFRGFLYGKLRERLAKETSNKVSIAVSIFLVSLLFAIIHGQWNVGVDVFALSVILCALREITGTIHAGILLHMLKNGIAFYLIYVRGIGPFM